MKTTLDLNDQLLADAKALAAQQRTSLTRLIEEGWVAQSDRAPLPFERRLAHNDLASLSGCSGTGLGFCRYDYQRGSQRFAVVTVPGPDGHGVVHNTFEPES